MAPTDCEILFGAVTRGRIGQRELERFTSGGALSPREGIANYRRMFLVRQLEAMSELFPITEGHLTPSAFQRMASSYVSEHPSRHPALEHVGAAFPAFLSRTGEDTASRIATLEWSALWVFLAEDETPQGTALIPPPARMAEARLELSRAIANLPFDARARGAWRDAGGAPIEGAEDPSATHVLVRRKQLEVRMRALGSAEAEALARAQRGEPLASVCEPFSSTPDPVTAAAATVRRWLSTGVARGFEGGA